VTNVTPDANSRTNTGQNDIEHNANFSHSTVLLVKTSKFTNMNNTTLENIFFFKYLLKKIWGSSHKIPLFHIKVIRPKNSQTLVTFFKVFERRPKKVILL
jgi:hypothetical protein